MKKLFIAAFVIAAIAAFSAQAASKPLVYSAWIPYWKKSSGTAEAVANLNRLHEVSPFAYSVGSDGLLVDTMKIDQAPWPDLVAQAKAKKVKVLPSVLWTDSAAIDRVLSNPDMRRAQIEDITGEVLSRGFDGIDIDYENKLASTSPKFSLFLSELSARLHGQGKTLSCTIEARTPPTSRYLTVPAKLEYANDFKAINKQCDQVRLMTYDQGAVDIKLNMAKRLGGFYSPVADPAWVRKVLDLAVKDISPKKISLGIATYGYEYEVTDKTKFFDYKKVRSLSYPDFVQLAAQTKSVPRRNNGGEIGFTYRTASSTMRFVTFSDNLAIADKVRIAQIYGLRGVSFFRLDGESDSAYWRYLK